MHVCQMVVHACRYKTTIPHLLGVCTFSTYLKGVERWLPLERTVTTVVNILPTGSNLDRTDEDVSVLKLRHSSIPLVQMTPNSLTTPTAH
jgi:hypothetical protein